MNLKLANVELPRVVSGRASWLALFISVSFGFAVLCGVVALTLAVAARGGSNAARIVWEKHREVIQRLPEERFHRDRFRAINGRVSDEGNMPVAGAVVHCAKLDTLVGLAASGMPRIKDWSVPIEAETVTKDDGTYEFPHLPVGGRSFFYSAPGRELAPAVKDLVVVQDGLGARLDVKLERPATLRVRLEKACGKETTLTLIA